MSTTISPLAPKTSPTCRRSPACGWRRPRPASAIRAAPMSCWRCSTRQQASPACSRARNVLRRRSSGAAPGSRADGRVRSWSIPAMPMPSPARTGARPARSPPSSRPASIGCKIDGSVSRLDRRHRRAAAGASFRRRHGASGRRGDRRRLRRRRRRHHDHRHVSKTRHRERAAWRHDRDHQRLCQGRRHDRARHGDHAGLRVHRRADRGAGAAGAAARGRRRHVQCRHHRRRHLDLRYARWPSRPARRAAHRASPAPTIRASCRSARPSTPCSPILPSRWRATAKARASWSRSWSKARCRNFRRAASRCRSPIRRWSRPRSPARTPIGAAWSWRSAKPASRPTATGCRSGSAASASPIRARAIRTTTRPPSPRR